MSRQTYNEYLNISGDSADKRIEVVEFNDNGKEYLDEIGNETVALAMQLKAGLILAENEDNRKTSEDNNIKSMNLKESLEDK